MLYDTSMLLLRTYLAALYMDKYVIFKHMIFWLHLNFFSTILFSEKILNNEISFDNKKYVKSFYSSAKCTLVEGAAIQQIANSQNKSTIYSTCNIIIMTTSLESE